MAREADGAGKSRMVGRPATARQRGSVTPLTGSEPSPIAAIEVSPDCELVNSLARGLLVLSSFGATDQMLGNKDIAQRTGIPKPSISRLTDTLVKLSFLKHDGQTGAYQLGPAALALGLTARKQPDVATIALPYIEEFAERTGTIVALGMLVGIEMRAHALVGSKTGGAYTAIGASYPIDRTALGLARLAATVPPDRAPILAAIARARGRHWPESQRRIEQATREYEQLGYCCYIGEWGGAHDSIAAPLGLNADQDQLALTCMKPDGGGAVAGEEILRLAPYFMGLIATIRSAVQQATTA